MVCFVNFFIFYFLPTFFVSIETLPGFTATVRRVRNIDQRTGHPVRPGGFQRRFGNEVPEPDWIQIDVRKRQQPRRNRNVQVNY